ncbi:MAG: DJ-1/PfpI family protein [Pseudomonadota bacterium]
MQKPLSGMTIAVLIANGFDETPFISMQRRLQETGATLKIISSNQGLVNGWSQGGWGHNYAVDAQLNTALGVDYDALVIPGGERSLEKLKTTAHTRRFIGSFMSADKPVAVMGDALDIMAHAEQLDGRTVSGDTVMKDLAVRSASQWNDEGMMLDQALLTGKCDSESLNGYIDSMIALFTEHTDHNLMDQAA